MLGCGCLTASLIFLSVLSSVLTFIVLALVSGFTHAAGFMGHGLTFFHRGFPMDIDNGTLAIVLVFGIPIIAIIGGVFLSALKILKGESGRKAKTNDAEEARMIQDIYHGLTKMEQRVEALETLLMDKQRKGNES
jgi:phage shock protein B